MKSSVVLPYGDAAGITADEILSLAARFRQMLEAELDGGLLITLPDHGDLFTASDIHGSLDALVRILGISGVPTEPDTRLLVLGDYLDKGKDSVAVLVNLMALKLAYPDRFFLLRGNHETRFWASWWMSFRRELRRRYGFRVAGRVYAGLLFAFDALPLAAVAPNGLVALHGGPPRSLSLVGMTQAVLHDVLWSDLHRSREKASRRWGSPYRLGHGRKVAAHEIEHFLAAAGKAVLLRGHSHTRKGVEVASGNVLTIISANSLERLGPMLGRRAQRGLVKVDLSSDLEDASQVEIRLF